MLSVSASYGQTPKSSPESGERPISAGRVVRAFDFEERDYNPLPVPLGWIRAQEDPDVPRVRPGFPLWNKGVLDYSSPAFSGEGTVKLPTLGGSTSLILRHGEINIFPDADYLVSARVRTVGVRHAKARVVAKLLDQRGNEIEGAESVSRLAQTNGRWEQVALEIEGIYPTAAFVQIELQLLQPTAQYEQHASAAFEVWEQDFDGAAWFDNLIIAQLPRLEMTTGKPGNIVESDVPPAIEILVRDLTGDEIVARMRVFDVHGREIDSQVIADGQRRLRMDWTPSLPGYGWYRAMLEVVVDNQLVGNRTLDFIWSSPSLLNVDSGMFGIHASLTDPKIAQSAPALIRGSGVSRATVEVWSKQTTLEDMNPDSITMLAINQLLSMETRLSVALAELPMPLADKLAVDPYEVMPVFAGPLTNWVGWAGSMFDSVGQAVSHWRFGDLATQESAKVLIPRLDRVQETLRGYIPGPVLVTPWSIDRPIDPLMIRPNRELLLIDHNATNEHTMSLVVEDWVRSASAFKAQRDQHPSELGIVLSPMNSVESWSGVEVWSSVGNLARKAISFWWSASYSGLGNERFELELTDAWWVSSGKRGQVMPAPELIVWKTLANQLGNRQAIEELNFVPGVRMLVAGPKDDGSYDDTGVLILWLERPSLEPAILNLPLAMGDVTACDVFNNEQIVPLTRQGDLELPMHRIEVGRSPIIVSGINPDLVRFLNSLQLSPDTLQAQSGVHKHELRVTNPWPFAIRGQLFIVEPGGYTGSTGRIDRSWEIVPRVIPFTLDSFEQRSIPVDIAYSIGEIAGQKPLTFDVELSADMDYPLMRVERNIELRLDGIDMQVTARKGNDGITIVSVDVMNRLETEQDFEVIAIPPREARLRRSINGITTGQRVKREFAFVNVNSGDEIVIALMLRDSTTRLNKSVIVP